MATTNCKCFVLWSIQNKLTQNRCAWEKFVGKKLTVLVWLLVTKSIQEMLLVMRHLYRVFLQAYENLKTGFGIFNKLFSGEENSSTKVFQLKIHEDLEYLFN